MTIRFAVAGKPVGKNASRGIHNGHFYLPKETKDWQRRVALAAHAAALAAGWPDPFAIARCSYRIFRYNVRGDADRGDTYAIDAMEYRRWPTPRGEIKIEHPIGLFENDQCAHCEGSYPSIADSRGARVEIEVTLLETRAPHEADARRARWYTNEVRRLERRAQKRKAKSRSADRSRAELAQIESNLGVRLPF